MYKYFTSSIKVQGILSLFFESIDKTIRLTIICIIVLSSMDPNKITKSFHHSQRKIDTGDKNSYENYNSKTTFQQCIVIQRLTSKHSSFFKPISYRLYQKVKRVIRLSINVHMSTLHVQSNNNVYSHLKTPFKHSF